MRARILPKEGNTAIERNVDDMGALLASTDPADVQALQVERVSAIEIMTSDDDGGEIRITTASPDRSSDRVLTAGGRLENYLKNPIVQWGHNYWEPWATIGRTEELALGKDFMDARFTLRDPANDADPQHVVRLLWRDGFVNAASIGFMVDKRKNDDDVWEWAVEQNELGGYDFESWELVEWSLVPVPANQEALRRAMKGLSGEARPCEECGRLFIEDERTAVAAVMLGMVDKYLCPECVGEHASDALDKRFHVLSGELLESLRDQEPRGASKLVIAGLESAFVPKETPPIDIFLEEHEGDFRVMMTPLEALELLALNLEANGEVVDGEFVVGLSLLTLPTIKSVIGHAQALGAIPYSVHGSPKKADEDLRWDASAARARIAKWATSDDEINWKRYRVAFSYVVDGEGDTRGGYKGPHHDIIDGELRAVWHGVRAAMGSLVFGARGGKIEDDGDRRGVYRHLARHYAQWDKDVPEFKEYDEEELSALFAFDENAEQWSEDNDAEITQEELDALAGDLRDFVSAYGARARRLQS